MIWWGQSALLLIGVGEGLQWNLRSGLFGEDLPGNRLIASAAVSTECLIIHRGYSPTGLDFR